MAKVVIVSLMCAVAVTPVLAKDKDKHKNKHKNNYQNESFYEEEMAKREKYEKSRRLPPGLQKKAARGQPLPPGWQKKLQVGSVLDPRYFEYAEEITPIDDRGVISIKVDDAWIDLYETSREIIRIMNTPQ